MLWKILAIIFAVLVIHLCLLYFVAALGGAMSSSSAGTVPRKLVVDTDAGADDAVALLLALTVGERLEIVAVTCTYGNTDLENVERNVLKILTVADRPDIPVYGGAKKPLVRNFTASDYFGNDGLGDFEFEKELITSIDRSKHAALALIDIVNKHPGEISILTLGSLTNVALAASLDPRFTENVDRFYVMGSNVDESSDKVEFNFGLDPESNAIFLESPTKQKSLIIPYDVVRKYSISKDWRQRVLGKVNSEVMDFLNKAEALILDKSDEWMIADSLAVAATIWPELVLSTVDAYMSADPCSPVRGSVQLETDSARNKTKNVEIVRTFDVNGLKEKFLQYLA